MWRTAFKARPDTFIPSFAADRDTVYTMIRHIQGRQSAQDLCEHINKSSILHCDAHIGGHVWCGEPFG